MSSTQNIDWEFSKENIQPLQQGRKPEILKHALGEHPEDAVQLQRQAFENELRTYNGNDPLSVWCKYIKWVEQNFPKGGRDGHYEQLVRKCVSILKDEHKYYDDNRFIHVWLKFANVSIKPIEVYNYMYSQNIGCHCANFFSAWSWELEQQGNIKKANQVLREGINRNAEPVEQLKSYTSEFEIRIARQMLVTEQESDCHRSAFTILKPQKNSVPIGRTGESVVEPSRANMIIGRQQPVPRREENISSTKMPFKIHNKETFVQPLPIQSTSGVPFVFHTDSSKENEIKPSKWNKVKLKQKVPVSQTSLSEIGFNFHCDEVPQPVCTPRSIPKVSDILHLRKNIKSPAMALFEPPDPTKRPMYDKNKVYGGAEEFSLEEIRAAAWLKQHCVLNNEKHLGELKMQASPLDANNMKKDICFKIHADEDNQSSKSTGQKEKSFSKSSSEQKHVNISRALLSPFNPKKRPIYDRNQIYNGIEELSFEEIKANEWMKSEKKLIYQQKELEKLQKQVQLLTQQVVYLESRAPNVKGEQLSEKHNDSQLYSSLNKSSVRQIQQNNSNDGLARDKKQTLVEQSEINLPAISQSESLQFSQLTNTQEQKEIQDKVTMNASMENYQIGTNVTEILQGKGLISTSYSEVADIMQQFYNGTLANIPKAILESELFQNINNDSFKGISDDLSNKKDSFYENVQKVELPFTVYQDSTQVKVNDMIVPNSTNSKLPFNVFHDPTDTVPQPDINFEINNLSGSDQRETNEEIENIPPNDYKQDTTKRELTGILTLSKNIEYVPLELQEQEEEEIVSDSEDICIYSNHPQFSNETLVPPCNTEQFSSAQFLSSTPCTATKLGKRQILPISKTDDEPEIYNTEKENCNMGPPPANVESVTIKQSYSTQRLDKNVYPVRPGSLSVIMESSKESYKSSASSGSSASVTKLSQFEHCYSYDKSNITNKDIPKADTFKEPKFINTEPNLTEIKKEVSQQDNKMPISFEPVGSIDDPFDEKFTGKLLQSLNQHPDHQNVLEVCDKSFKHLKINDKIKISEATYLIEDLIAEGAYGKVFLSDKQDNLTGIMSSKFALKVCKHANEWELYICSTLHKRLEERKNNFDVCLSVMDIIAAQKCDDGMILVTEYCRQGTLLDLVNFHKKQNLSVSEYLTLYCTLELLQIISKIHECKIIHADIKPDNVMLWNFPSNVNMSDYLDQKTCFLRIIDFGRSIDLHFFQEGISFTYPLKSRCIETLENKPWVFQPDWLGFLDCVHTLLFGEYMKVKLNKNGRWEIEKKLKRYWSTEIWSPLFDELLNIPSGYKEPNVHEHINRIKNKLRNNIQCLKSEFAKLQNNFVRK